VALPNHGQIQKLIKVLGTDFALSLNSNMRKGGLIGLAAMAIALGKVSNESRICHKLLGLGFLGLSFTVVPYLQYLFDNASFLLLFSPFLELYTLEK
jgi:hypothetical protein